MRILFFASLRDRLKTGEETLTSVEGIHTAGELILQLRARGEPWLSALEQKRIKIAVNQELATWDTPISLDDEVALFPPVTGG